MIPVYKGRKELSMHNKNIMILVFPITVFLLLLLEAVFNFQFPVLYLVILIIQDIYLYFRTNKKLYLVIFLIELCSFLLYWRSTTYSYFVHNSDPDVVTNPELFSSLIRQAQILNYRRYKSETVIISILKTLYKNS